MQRKQCLRPGCDDPVVGRGLCCRCYRIACELVREGRTTWGKLVQRGRAAEAQRHIRFQAAEKGTITAWFLGVNPPAGKSFAANRRIERG